MQLPEDMRWVNDLDVKEACEGTEGLVRELIEMLGVQSTARFLMRFQGLQVYVPKIDNAFRMLRNARIRAEFTGANHAELARKYRLSQVYIYEVLRGRDDEPDQDNLFS